MVLHDRNGDLIIEGVILYGFIPIVYDICDVLR